MIKHLLPGWGDAGVVEVFAGMRNSGSEAVAASSSSSATYRSKCFALVSTILPWGFDWVVGGAHLVAPHVTFLHNSSSCCSLSCTWSGKASLNSSWCDHIISNADSVPENMGAAAHSKKQVMSHMSLRVCFTWGPWWGCWDISQILKYTSPTLNFEQMMESYAVCCYRKTHPGQKHNFIQNNFSWFVPQVSFNLKNYLRSSWTS